MRTLEHFVAIGSHLNGIESRLKILAQNYKEAAPRTPIDEALIQAFDSRAAELNSAAQALMTVAYDPTPPPPPEDPEAPGAPEVPETPQAPSSSGGV